MSLTLAHSLYLALPCRRVTTSARRVGVYYSRESKTYSHVEHAGLGSILILDLLGALLEKNVDLGRQTRQSAELERVIPMLKTKSYLQELVVAGLLGEGAAVLNGLLELGGLGGRHLDRTRWVFESCGGICEVV